MTANSLRRGGRRAAVRASSTCRTASPFDDSGTLYVADRANKRIQLFTPDGEYLGEWTGMGGPNDISRGKDGNFYIAEQEDAGNPAYVDGA